MGTVDVTLRTLTGPPEGLADGYQVSAERDLDVDSGQLELRGIMDPQPVQVIAVAPGRYRVRVSATGRWDASLQPDSNLERHLIEAWPSTTPENPTLLTAPDDYARAYLQPPG